MYKQIDGGDYDQEDPEKAEETNRLQKDLMEEDDKADNIKQQ